ncbi:MAG: carboxypeptidase regulatory-like domain-containing protein [bacterium]|nr:carboxypeptidase regulatory-like domain-containing protein [bacterium]
MQRNASTILLLIFCTLTGLVALYVNRPDAAQQGLQTANQAAAEEALANEEELLELDGEPVRQRQAEHVSAPATFNASLPMRPSAVPERTGRIRVLVTEESTGLPVSGLFIGIGAAREGITAAPREKRHGGPMDHMYPTDATGSVTIDVGADLVWTIRNRTIPLQRLAPLPAPTCLVQPDGSLEPVEIVHTFEEVPAVQEGAELTYSYRVRRVSRGLCWLKIVDAETGDAIQGARVLTQRPWAGSMAATAPMSPWKQGKPWPRSSAPKATSDMNGLAGLPWKEGSSGVFEVHAKGFAPAWVANSNRFTDPRAAKLVELTPSASLTGSIGGRFAGQDLTVEVSALASNAPRGPTILMRFQYHLWTSKLDASGRFSILGLPPDTDLMLQVRQGDKTLFSLRDPIVLAPGEHGRFDWIHEPLHPLRAQFLDSEGEGIANKPIWLQSIQDTNVPRGTIDTENSPLRYQVSDSRGRVHWNDLQEGMYLLGPVPAHGKAAPGFTIRLPHPGTLVFKAEALSSISGRVTLAGVPAANVILSASPDFGSTYQNKHSAEDGTFEFTGLVSGLYGLTAHQFNSTGKPVFARRAAVPTGSRNVLLELQPSCEITLLARKANSEDPMPANWLTGGRQINFDKRPRLTTNIGDFGADGAQRIWAEAEESDRHWVGHTPLLHATPGSTLPETEVTLKPAASALLLGSIPTDTFFLIFLKDGTLFRKFLLANGKPESPLFMPPGKYGLQLEGRYGTRSLGTTTLKLDEPTEIPLGPQ